MLPEPLTETESAGRDIRTCQLQSSNSSFRAGTSLAVSPWVRDFQDSKMCTHLVPLRVSGTGWDRSLLCFLGSTLAIERLEKALTQGTIAAYNAERATSGNPATVQHGSPALLALWNSRGNCFDKRSNHKGSTSYPLPASACAQLTLSMLFEPGLHHS